MCAARSYPMNNIQRSLAHNPVHHGVKAPSNGGGENEYSDMIVRINKDVSILTTARF